MRRLLLAVGAVVLLVAPARPGTEDLGDDAGGVLIAVWGDEKMERAFSIPDERLIDVDAMPDPVQPFVRELLRDPLAFEVTAFRRRAPGAADAFLASDVAQAGPADLEALRTEIAAGTLVEVGRTALSAEAGEPVEGEDLTDVGAALGSDIEAAIGVAVTFPTIGRVRTGLAVWALPVLETGGACTVRYRVIAGADAAVREVETIAGRRTAARAESFSAVGAATLMEGGTAVARGVRPGGDGFVITIRVTNVPDVSLPQRLGSGWLALPGTLRDLDGSASLGYVGTIPALTRSLDDPVEGALGGLLDDWAADLEPPPTDTAWEATADELLRPPVGVCFARAAGRGEAGLSGLAHRAAQERSPRTVTVAHPHAGRIVVPTTGGHAAQGFLGTLRTTADGFDVETGCHSCVGVAESVVRDGYGLSFAAVVDGGGGIEIDVCARAEEERESRTFAARRSLPGHSDITYDDVSLDFTTDSILRARTRVPAGGGRIAGEIDVSVTGARRADPTLRPVDVGGRRLWLMPGEWARLLVHHRTPHVVDWAWEASCGMTFRAPLVSALSAGTHAALRLRDDRSLDVAAMVTRPPQIHGSAFDMKDGVVEVLRQPFLVLRTTFPSGTLGRVARGRGCELRLDMPGTDPAALRTATATTAGADHDVRYADGAPVLFAAGGTSWLPESLRQYVSNHQSGEAVVAPVPRHDGVVVELDAADDGIARGILSVRTRCDLTSFDLKKLQAPGRPDTDVSLLLPDQRVRRWALTVPVGDTVERATPGGMPDPIRFRTTAPSEEDDE